MNKIVAIYIVCFSLVRPIREPGAHKSDEPFLSVIHKLKPANHPSLPDTGKNTSGSSIPGPDTDRSILS